MSNLRTVPTIVSAHTFSASSKAWFNHHARVRVGIREFKIYNATALRRRRK